jgi:hypothetical protein
LCINILATAKGREKKACPSREAVRRVGRGRARSIADRGSTNISDSVVQKIAGIAAQEVEKVQVGGGTAAAVTGFLRQCEQHCDGQLRRR